MEKIRLLPYAYLKINFMLIKKLNMKNQSFKHLKEHVGKYVHDIREERMFFKQNTKSTKDRGKDKFKLTSVY